MNFDPIVTTATNTNKGIKWIVMLQKFKILLYVTSALAVSVINRLYVEVVLTAIFSFDFAVKFSN